MPETKLAPGAHHAFVEKKLDIRSGISPNYYYSQLSEEDRRIYDAMYGVALDPTTTENVAMLQVSWDVYDDEAWTEHCYKVSFALAYDHLELWWISRRNGINGFHYAYNISPDPDGTYGIYINMDHVYETAEQDITSFNQAVDAFLAKIDPSAGEESLARQVHDGLLQLVSYNESIYESQGNDLARTAYSAMVADSSGHPHSALCSGYATAYAYLLQRLGVEATIILGMAGYSGGALEGHVWNIVKIGGSWYEVDVTWDDTLNNIIQNLYKDYTSDPNRYQLFYESATDPAFTEQVSHTLFMLKTSEIRSLNRQIRFTASNGWYWDWQHVSERYRFDELDPSTIDGHLMKLAPLAS